MTTENQRPVKEDVFLFVTCGVDKTQHIFGNDQAEIGKIPTLVFPAEHDETLQIMRNWFITENPKGTPAINAPDWNVFAVRNRHKKDESLLFFLRDKHGISHQIKFSWAHHAIHYKDWAEYDMQIESFKLRLEKNKTIRKDLTEKAQLIATEDQNDDIKEKLDQLRENLRYWNNNLDVWIHNTSPEKTRLLWADQRLHEAELAQADLKNKFQKILKAIEAKKQKDNHRKLNEK